MAAIRHSIVHLTGDFPDPIGFFKTRVIESFIDLTSTSFDHTVFSINRKSPPPISLARQIAANDQIQIEAEPFAYGTALSYEAPARGFLHKTRLIELGEWLADQINKSGETPKLLIGHKLTIEGIAVHQAAKILGIPYAITIQSHTDDKILRARPDLKRLFAQIYHDAELVFAFSPIARANVEAKLQNRSGPTRIIPCPTDLDTPLEPKVSDASLLSVFHLKNRQTKNLAGIAKAVKLAHKEERALTLDLVGGGEPDDFEACKAIIGSNRSINLIGSLDRNGVRKRMNEAKAFVMPSLSESFGLVFIEALYAGLPIIYPAGRAIDGFFDDCDFAISVDPRDPQAIADAMIFVSEKETVLKQSLARWHKSEAARAFARPKISKDYSEALRNVLNR